MEPVVGTKERDSRMERGHREMYRVRIGERGKYGEEVYTARREKTSFAHEGWRGKGMNGDCRPRGRDEWPGTRGGNGGETRARKEDPREEANEDERKGGAGRCREVQGGAGRSREESGKETRGGVVSRRQSPSTVAGVPTG